MATRESAKPTLDRSPTMTALQSTIVTACQAHFENHWQEGEYRAALRIPNTNYFVKFGNPSILLPEFAMQKYIFTYAKDHPNDDAPRIPEPLFYFLQDNTIYLVFEYIELMDSPADFQRRSDALKWLTTVPVPPGHEFGPFEGGRICHRFFKDWVAPLKFSSIEAIERYIEKGRTQLSRQGQRVCPPVSLKGERVIFMQADIHISNFGVDTNGKTVMMDFMAIAPLPASFVSYILSSTPHLEPLAESLGLSDHPNLHAMAMISYKLWQRTYPKLGLDDDGFPDPTIKFK